MSPEALRFIQLPPGTPKRVRLNLMLLRFVAHHNRLEGALAGFAIYWGALTLLAPGFWGGWPVTEQLEMWTGGSPAVLSWTLLLAGLGSYVSRWRRWHGLRTLSACAAFSSWGMLTLLFFMRGNVPGFACYSALAFAKLISYLNFVLQVDERDPG